MKKLKFTLLSLCICSVCFAQKQYIQVMLPKDNKMLLVDIKEKKTISINGKRFSLVPSYPNAKTSDLQYLYDIVIDSEEADIKKISTEFQKTGYFE